MMSVTRSVSWPMGVHLLLLLGYAGLMTWIWMIPGLLAGVPQDVYPLLSVRNFAATGLFSVTDEVGRFLSTSGIATEGIPSASDARLSTVLFSLFVPFVPLTHLSGWMFLTASVFAGSLLTLWLAVAAFFGRRTAWVTIALYALMPIYWREAIWLNHYQFALLFLFLSFASFGWLRSARPLAAYMLSGLFFGAAIASRDAFIIFVPWFLLCELFFFKHDIRKGILHAAVFFSMAGFVYALPYIGDVVRYGYPVNQNLARIWPGAREIQEDFYLHLYPDPYTYFFDRERFDAELVAKLPTLSTLARLQYQKILLNFDVGKPGFLTSFLNGAWLFAGSIPSYFLLDTIGGVAVWFLILPGFYFLWRRDRRWFFALFGLVLLSEGIIRFVLHYARDHLMDTGWVFALVAAVGVVGVANTLAAKEKRMSSAMIATGMTLLLCGHLLQANRVRFANVYEKNRVPDTVSAAEAIAALPPESVIALPLGPSRLEQIAVLADRTLVLFAPETIHHLSRSKKIPDAFRRYGVTHIMRYDPAQTRTIVRAVPGIQVIKNQEQEPGPPPVSTAVRFLLHLIR